MIIKKILNNNVALIDDSLGAEAIVWGKGLAFNKKVGDEVSEEIVEKVFSISDSEIFLKLQEVLKDIPLEYFEISSEILRMVQEEISEKVNESLFISLSDHIYATVLRYEEGVTIKNPLVWDIQRFYPKEFKIGVKAVDIVEERFRIALPKDEAAFIAMHIVNAVIDEDNHDHLQDEGYKITIIIQEILNIIRYFFKLEINEESAHYFRFVSHLKFFAQRLVSDDHYKNETDPELYEMVINKYRNSYQCVGRISNFIEKKYAYVLTIDEKLYLTVHIQRVVYNNSF